MNLLKLKTYFKQFVMILSILSFTGINHASAYNDYNSTEIEDLINKVTRYEELPMREQRQVLSRLVDQFDDINKVDHVLIMLRRMLFLKRMGGFDNGDIENILDINHWRHSRAIPSSTHIFLEIDAQIEGTKPVNRRAIQTVYLDNKLYMILSATYNFQEETASLIRVWDTLPENEKKTFVDINRREFFIGNDISDAPLETRVQFLERRIKGHPIMQDVRNQARVLKNASRTRRVPRYVKWGGIGLLVTTVPVLITSYVFLPDTNDRLQNLMLDPTSADEFLEALMVAIYERMNSLDQEIAESETRPNF